MNHQQLSFFCLSLRGVFPNGEWLGRSNPSLKTTFLWLIFLVFPSFLWASPPLAEPSGNTRAVESSANTLSAHAPLSLPEVVVTANRLDTPVSQVANSMTVITSRDIAQKQAGTVLNALQGVPGLTLLQNGSPGESSGIFVDRKSVV